MQKRSNFFFETIFGGWTIPWPFSKEAGVSHRWKGQALDGIFRGILPHICRVVRIGISIRGSRQVPAALPTALGVSPCHWGLTFGYHQLYHLSLSLYNWRINVNSCDFCPRPCSLYHGNILFRSYFVIWQNAEKGHWNNASCSLGPNSWHPPVAHQLGSGTLPRYPRCYCQDLEFGKNMENIRKKMTCFCAFFPGMNQSFEQNILALESSFSDLTGRQVLSLRFRKLHETNLLMSKPLRSWVPDSCCGQTPL